MAFTLEDVRREYDRLDALCGTDTSQLRLRISTRAKKRLGSCKYIGSRVECITISDFVLTAPEDVFFSTVRHEYAHALVKLRFPNETHGHDAVWKSACLEVGCPPERCCDPSALPAPPQRREEPYRYRLRCLVCGRHWDYKRETRVLRLVARSASRFCVCPYCQGQRCKVESLL